MKITFKIIPAAFFFLITLVIVCSPGFAVTVALHWAPNTEPDITGYKVHYQADSSNAPFHGTGAIEGASPLDVGNQRSATIRGLDPGLGYYFAVTAYNAFKSESYYSNIAYIPESIPPNIAITSVTSPTNQTSQNLVGTVGDNVGVASVVVKIGADSPSPATINGPFWSYPVSGLIVGTNSITVTAQDTAGNTATASTTIVVDLTPPVINTFTVPATSNSLTVSGITLTGTDNIGVSGYLINESATPPAAAAVNQTQPPTSYVATSAGSKTLYAWVRDAAGNVSAGMSATLIIDMTPPAISITPVTSPTFLSSQTLAGTVTDNVGVASVTVTVGTASPVAATISGTDWTCSVTNLAFGTNSIIVTATDQAGNKASAQSTIFKATPLTKAKIFMGGGDDNFTLSNSGAILYGSMGNNEISIASGVTAAILDQNIERINFTGPSSNYAFRQTGNIINVYDATGAILLVKAPVQGDSDGTLLGFSDGTASALLAGGVMRLGGATVSPVVATSLPLKTTASSTLTATITKAKVYLGTDDSFTVSSSGTTLYGSAGNDTVTIAAGVTGVILDQNVEQIDFSNVSSGYAFKQTGNIINVYDATGAILLVKAPVQGDSDGTLLSFGDGTASALLAGGVMTVGDAVVSAGTPTTLTPTLKPLP